MMEIRLEAFSNYEPTIQAPNPLVGIVQKLERGEPVTEIAGFAQQRVMIVYENHRNEVMKRYISPIRIMFGQNNYHLKPCWLLEAFDHDRQAFRTFDMSKILRWGF